MPSSVEVLFCQVIRFVRIWITPLPCSCNWFVFYLPSANQIVFSDFAFHFRSVLLFEIFFFFRKARSKEARLLEKMGARPPLVSKNTAHMPRDKILTTCLRARPHTTSSFPATFNLVTTLPEFRQWNLAKFFVDELFFTFFCGVLKMDV